MAVEREKIDIENWVGPMTVVGYPDLTAEKYLPHSTAIKAKKPARTNRISSQSSNNTPKSHT